MTAARAALVAYFAIVLLNLALLWSNPPGSALPLAYRARISISRLYDGPRLDFAPDDADASILLASLVSGQWQLLPADAWQYLFPGTRVVFRPLPGQGFFVN